MVAIDARSRRGLWHGRGVLQVVHQDAPLKLKGVYAFARARVRYA